MFALPHPLAAKGFSLRPETEDDIPFLVRLYASTREAELAPIPWSPEQKKAFLAQQFQAQRYHYRTYIDGCRFEVLEHAGIPIGRLYLEERPTRLHIVDIALLPEWCGKGIGSAILKALMAAGSADDRGVGIMVEKHSPALRLYRRLCFTDIEDHGVYLEMEWLPKRRRAVS